MSQGRDPFAATAVIDSGGRATLMRRTVLLRYLIAGCTVCTAIIALVVVVPSLGKNAPFAPLLGMVLAIAYWLGPGPALFATISAALLADALLITPGKFLFTNPPEDNLRILLFICVGSFMSWISARWHQATAALVDREQKLRILLDKMPMVLWSTDAALKLTSSSAALSYLFSAASKSRGPEAPPLAEEFFQSNSPDFLPIAAQRRAVGGEAVSYDLDAGDRFFHVHVEPMRGPDGSITGSFGMAWDITAQHRAEALVYQANQDLEARVSERTDELARANQVLMQQIAERKRAERELREVARHARCILWHAQITKSPDVKRPFPGLAPLHWELRMHDEEAAQQMIPLNVREGSTYAKAWYAARPPEDAEAMDRLSDRAILSGQHGYSQEFRCRDRGGNEHWLLESVSIQARGLEAWYAVGVVTDITESKLAQAHRDAQREQVMAERAARAEAEAASRAKDEFFAVLSHELRTPMTPVLMTVSSLEQDERLPEAVRSDLRMVRRNVELEARLIDDLLDLTRIARGKLEVAWRDLDVHSLLCHSRDACTPDADARDLHFELSNGAKRCFVRGDATRMQQVFWNLLRNAIKFTPEGGTIRLHTSNDDHGRLVVSVIDSGIGIEPEVLPRIFDAFEQGGRDMTRRFGGLGLGLAISKALVNLHGGTLTAESEGTGKGATFTVTLPTVEASVVEPSVPRVRAGDGPALRILLVEDHVDTQRATARLLRSFGHEVSTAESVATGLEVVEAHTFDLVISDLGLPDGSGLDLMRQIKQRYGLKGIALSGFGMESDLLNSRAAGFDHHLTKPVPIEQLDAAVRQVAAMEVGAG